MKLHEIAHARTGDKGDVSNISVIAYDPAHWPIIRDHVTPARVAAHFGSFAKEDVTRYTLPHLHALNFVIRGALTGGVTRSLALDAHGKCLASVLLEMEIDMSASLTD
ncbi:hypothetical protein [uncultured Paracoccus sp.]|uniref:AtuA-related protein n=1 Tax=uncultured Paracoccus sp. TaxID=189685 RepID=UPI002637A143|nr:hypothetical protein [uncultured Paracoccus sp.]HMR36794.1 hypothetical protein [Paracoccus sp. (in: a-proteobacteria)]